MSYILDALKRADAERERGQVPGLHAQPLGDAGSGPLPGGSPRWALWAGVAAGVLVMVALAWRMGADANAPLPAPIEAPPAIPAPADVAVAEPPPAVTTAVPSYAPPPAPVAPVKPAKPEQTPVAPAAAASAPEPARIPLLAELPAATRQRLPALSVGGTVYSDDAASRFIMLDGEVVKEGGQPAPGLVLERIEPRSAVLRYQGQRFRIGY